MQKENKFLIFAGIVLLASFVIFLNVIIQTPLDKKFFLASVEVSDRGGFDLNKSALTFGKITPGGSSSRQVELKNNYDFPIKVEIWAEGDIKEFLEFEEVVSLDVGEEKKISFSASALSDEEFKKYSGNVVVLIRKDI